MKLFSLLIMLSIFFHINAQDSINEEIMDTLPYYEIPEYPKTYTQHTTVARMIDGLGYRYHWVSKDLREYDLAYLPGNNGKGMRDVLEHLAGLSNMILNAVHNRPHEGLKNTTELTYPELRKLTLENIQEASQLLKSNEARDLKDTKIIFVRGDNRNEMEFWHILNGPLADALYHCGQVVSYRRTAGNPIDPNVSVFMGKNKQ